MLKKFFPKKKKNNVIFEKNLKLRIRKRENFYFQQNLCYEIFG